MLDEVFLMCAGEGVRMRPLTDDKPKPMIPVLGRPMIDWMLDGLVAGGIRRAVINLHYRGEMIAGYLAGRATPKIDFSREETRLETGGGAKYALPLFSPGPFFAANSDVIWVPNDGYDPFQTMRDAWDADKMDVLLMLCPLDRITGFDGPGDYTFDQTINGPAPLRFNRERVRVGHMFMGIRIVNPAIFDDAPDGVYSFVDLFHAAEKKGRLYGMVFDGLCYHVGTPDGLRAVETAMGQSPKPHLAAHV